MINCKNQNCENDTMPLRKICSECHKIYTRQYYKNNKDTIKAQSKRYCEEHKEEKREYFRQYYLRNKLNGVENIN